MVHLSRNINKPMRILLVMVNVAVTLLVSGCGKAKTNLLVIDYPVTNATINSTVISVGTIEPKNRLELNPPINGRLDEILVHEGDKVAKGQVVAWLSSIDRAAVLDAASTLNKDEQDYWKSVYKPTPLISSIDGEVIVRSVEPGQSVSMSKPVIVISDRLIVRVRVDETDVGKIKVGMSTRIKLDAYPDINLTGRVDRISYESKLVSNVVVYEVDVEADTVPSVFRSGMSVEVTISYQAVKDVLVIPFDSVNFNGGTAFVTVKSGAAKEEEQREVTLGVTDNRNYEVIGGLKLGDVVVVRRKDASVFQADNSSGSNPFMPMQRRGRGK